MEIPLAGVGLRHTILKGSGQVPAKERTRPVILEEEVVDKEVARLWEQRDHIWQVYRSASLLVSPSDFVRKPSRLPTGKPTAGGHRLAGNVFGTIVHRVLQHWDFAGDVEPQLAAVRVTSLARDVQDDRDQQGLLDEIRQLLRTFAGSDPYARLRRATVIGREVPFLMPWNEGGQILEGFIDVLYHLDGQLWIADYKTDMIPVDQVATRAEAYREQARLYRESVVRSLGEPVAGFEFIFLRHGVAITV